MAPVIRVGISDDLLERPTPCMEVLTDERDVRNVCCDKGAYQEFMTRRLCLRHTCLCDQQRQQREVRTVSEVTTADAQHVLAGLRVGLPDIAATAGVRRPVVSIWRTRYAHGEDPFPAPVARSGQQPFFAAADVVDWMSRRTLGNNPDFGVEIAVRALRNSDDTSGSADETGPDDMAALTALLRLKAAAGAQLADLVPEDALDLADDVDPDDADSYREIEAAEPHLPRLLSLADVLADAAFTPAAALEAVLDQTGSTPQENLSPAALELLAHVASALQRTSRLTVADPDPGQGDLLTAVLGSREHLEAPLALIPLSASRALRRRLAAHGWDVQAHDLQGGFGAEALVLTAVTEGELSAVQVLTQVEEVALRLAPGQRAVVLGPARALMEPAEDREAEAVRSGLLRTDKLRAAVVLPEGLVLARSRERLALWVLGEAHPDVPIAGRWVMVADVADSLIRGGALDVGVLEDLLTDLVAAMGTPAAVSAHAFAHARFTLTSRILAAGAGLVEQSRPLEQPVRDDDGAAGARVLELLEAAGRPEEHALSIAVQASAPVATRTVRLGDLADRGVLRRRAGNRLPTRAIHDRQGTPGEVAVLGGPELAGEAEVGSRVMSKLDLAELASGRLTEPGDVVFTTTPRPAAMVDMEGFSVVEYPAQVLRVGADGVGLVPAVLADQISAQAPEAKRWRQWQVRLVPPGQAPQLADALAQVARVQAQVCRRDRALRQLSKELMAGVAAGVVRVRHDDGGCPPEEE